MRALCQIGKWLRLGHEPLAESRVPPDYFGINVATSQDPAVDDYLLARLDDLGIKQVRMDFSYDSPGGPAERLLERLLAADFNVMLEVFPSMEEAQQLFKKPAARARWGEFLDDIFQRYSKQVEWFEIGSTPNRGRWSGFSFLSYQAAWAEAVKRAKGYDVTLAGPNVSDFEPFYNASFLAYMKRFGRSPDLHSDNLFVERVIEPEAYDHRVFGRFATHWLKLNLLKKARILQRIGEDHGAGDTVCTYKCWTAKRLARRSAWPERKRVDYLVRYLALAASSGAMRRVYWGPMICSRDGLISDAVEGYPVIDQVSYYQGLRGKLEDFEITTGFRALGNTVKRFAGARCVAILHQPYGLSLFRFQPDQGNPFILAWCRDGMTWPLRGIFSVEELAAAHYENACGETVPQPAVITEEPLFIEFSGPNVSPRLRELHSGRTAGVIHLSSARLQSTSDSEDDWLGACMLRADHQLEDLPNAVLLRPSKLPELEETAVLRDARNRIWNVKDPRGLCDQVSVKLNRVVGAKRLTYRFRPSKGRRHWNNACEMLRRGVRTPTPVAFYEQREQAGIRDSWYLCEFVPDAFSARDVYGAFLKGESGYRGLNKGAWFKLLAEFTCHMHNCQIVHRDLSAGNLLLQQTGNTVKPYLIDIGRAWLGNGSGLSHRHRLQDLMRICYKLDWTDREAFVRCYEASRGRHFPSWWRLPFHYYDYKQKFKKTIKGQRKKRRK